ncbi:MAG: DUF368 domain-containing protein, partial [Clostridia bacterium]
MLYVKCLCIGLLMSFPGISGGSVACLFGIYEPMLENAAAIFSSFKKAISFFLVCVLGGISGIVLFSLLFSDLVLKYSEIFRIILFCFMIFSLPFFIKQNKLKLKSAKNLLFIAFGTLLPFLINILIKNLPLSFQSDSFLFVFAAGIFLAIAFILPGISFSYMLLFLGLYDKMFLAINNMDICFLFFLLIGLVIGFLLFSKIINYCFKKYVQLTYSIVTGFVLSSSFLILF